MIRLMIDIYIYISCITLRTLNYGIYIIFPILGNAGFISSTVVRIGFWVYTVGLTKGL